MSKRFRNRPVLFVLLGLGLGLLVGVGMMIGTLTVLTSQQSAGLTLPPTLLHATASHSGESMAIATGQIDADVEGLFVLDYLTGDLQCFVVHPRLIAMSAQTPTNSFYSVLRHNVIRDLNVEPGKKPNFAMVTGMVDVPRGSLAGGTPIPSVVYVVDANSGNLAAYTIMWDRNAHRTGVPQPTGFKLVGVGKARSVEIRD